MDLFTQPEHVPPAVTENPKVVEAFELWRLPADLHFVIVNALTSDYAQRAYDIHVAKHWNAFNLAEVICECPHQSVVDQAWEAMQTAFPVQFVKMAQRLVAYSLQPGLCSRAADALFAQGDEITNRQLAHIALNAHVGEDLKARALSELANRGDTESAIEAIIWDRVLFGGGEAKDE
jgi:hypothetical protein